MEICTMKLSDLRKPERNVRIHSEKQVKELKRSLAQFGQTRAIVIDENNTILIGNGLYQAMMEAGFEEASVYVKAGLTENEKKKLMIADNKTYALGIDNLETLNSFLEELQGDLDIPGYDEEILRQMVADADEVTEKISEYGTLDEDEIKSIREKGAKMEAENNNSGSEDYEVARNPENGEPNSIAPRVTAGEPAETRRYVICPKCGEQIWL
ncbi:MAG: ParB/Srx family N-terminal domain-containing protein [Lachnospiraceae bacterium]|nr:ParB/Srx family N-terminal domain-containing protein [Lachnospiraceae bacterium]